jgi:hypothetical protein
VRTAQYRAATHECRRDSYPARSLYESTRRIPRGAEGGGEVSYFWLGFFIGMLITAFIAHEVIEGYKLERELDELVRILDLAIARIREQMK